MTTYIADVTHEDNWWVGIVRDLPGAHAQARGRGSLALELHEVIRLVLDLPEDTPVDVELVFE